LSKMQLCLFTKVVCLAWAAPHQSSVVWGHLDYQSEQMTLKWSTVVVLGLAGGVGGACPNKCSGHGECLGIDNVCSCYSEWDVAADCSLRACAPGKAWADEASGMNLAHQPVECSNRGSCDRASGECLCDSGFEGGACDKTTCPNDCNGHGVCTSMRYLAKSKPVNSFTPWVYQNVWDHDMLYGCVCDTGFSGYDCSKRVCVTGDDPLTVGQLDEIQQVLCTADFGMFALTFDGETTGWISADASAVAVAAALSGLPNLRKVDVSFSAGDAASACSGGTMTLTFTEDPGDLPPLSVVGGSLACANARCATTPTLVASTVQDGTKENLPCNGRGRCDEATGECRCFLDYTTWFSSADSAVRLGPPGNCGAASNPIDRCPADALSGRTCSGHGLCNAAAGWRCECHQGWLGGDCGARGCAYGRAWLDLPVADDQAHTSLAECSAMGHCDRRRGLCECAPGFEGGACENLSCPAGLFQGRRRACSGHGACLSMALLAREATVNGDPVRGRPGAVGLTRGLTGVWGACRVRVRVVCMS
jgi:hypothetical protein